MKTTKRMKTTAEDIRLEYVMTAAWYWFRAVEPGEHMTSAISRLRADQLRMKLLAYGIPEPSAEEIYRYAAEKWPAHQLHPAPAAEGAK